MDPGGDSAASGGAACRGRSALSEVASDALWAGLPLITCRGESFAGRVAASLLRAVDLPELITDSLDEYESLALKLANDRALLQSHRDRLIRDPARLPLLIARWTKDVMPAGFAVLG
jgi:protein O-GlcNAc transferase